VVEGGNIKMSMNIDGIPIIAVEEDNTCAVCGKIDETRPYGVGGARICYDCGQKNLRETEYQMVIRLFGESPEDAEIFVTKKFGPRLGGN
jgi:hypothetical protein